MHYTRRERFSYGDQEQQRATRELRDTYLVLCTLHNDLFMGE